MTEAISVDAQKFRSRKNAPIAGVISAPRATLESLGAVPQTQAHASLPTQMNEVTAGVVQEMRERARERKEQAEKDQAAALVGIARASAALAQKKWLYNSNTENISEFPETFLIVDDGYFEYTPSANFPFTDEEKDVHLEFCRSRVNTKPIDGVANAKRIRNNTDQVIAQTQYMPPQPQSVERSALSIETVV